MNALHPLPIGLLFLLQAVPSPAAPLTALPVTGSPDLSADARFVAFPSPTSTYVSGDTNNADDIFVYDRTAATYARVSIRGASTQANGASRAAAISGDGTRIAFTSDATNLDAAVTTFTEAFVRDTGAGTTIRVSVAADGGLADGNCSAPLISRDGRFVGFTSKATNLVAGDTNGVLDGFVRDLQAGVTTRETVGPDGVEGNEASSLDSLSADGRYVTFTSYATSFGADTGGIPQVYRRDRQTGDVALVSATASATGNDWSMGSLVSADGRYVAFTSAASNLVEGDTNGVADVFVRDMTAGTIARVSRRQDGSQPDDDSALAGMSADGRYVCFLSHENGILPADANSTWDVYVLDRTTGRIVLVSAGPDGAGNDTSGLLGTSMTPDGAYVAFRTFATNLSADLPNGGVALAGPLAYPLLPFTMADAARALKISAGRESATADDMARFDVAPDGGDKSIALADVARIARQATGLEG